MKVEVVLMALFVASGASALAQGTFQVTFDGAPVQPPDTDYAVTYYYESGVSFRPIPPSHSFGRVGPYGGGPQIGWPDDGSAYFDCALTDSLMFGFTNGWVFTLLSVDLAEYGMTFQEPLTVRFVGYRFGGSIVTTDFTTDGIIDGAGPLADFQTFHFNPADWTGLQRVEVPGWGWSMDNLVVSVPEPGVWSLLVLGGGMLCAGPLRRRR